jgi:putative flippase GtrA
MARYAMTRRPAVRREAATTARAAFSSILATLADGLTYEIVVLLTMVSGDAMYGAGAFAGALIGGFTNFALNRLWVFRAQDEPALSQGVRYAIGSLLTLAMLEGLLWILIDRMHLDARVAWLPGKLVTWAAFSYPFQRIVVFAGAER